jgi:hypothetical protein
VTQAHDNNASQGNGSNPQPQIEKVFEPLDQERWVEVDTQTGRREIAFSDDVKMELGTQEDEDDESKSN